MLKAEATSDVHRKLDKYYHHVMKVFLSRQDPVTGLLPASTMISEHGDYTDAWVRDNVYSILAVWGLALAYNKVDDVNGRKYELEQSVVKVMRGLLFCMMGQASKVEKFKVTNNAMDCLHAKYNTHTGRPVVGDDQWGHLQLDATSLFVLQLAQMTASGLRIIFTIDEVNFIQNLVFYMERAFHTPDYGIWERGQKINHGNPELNASSIGMVKAALESINGINLFGGFGGPGSVIHAFDDTIARNRTTLHSLLPRESASKEIDAALLSVLSYPAFAVEDKQIINRTFQEINEKLEGNYGCKRFLRDGHQTVLEDRHRLHYEPHELKLFEHIESEWPVFFTYMLLDAIFREDAGQTKLYREKIEKVLVEQNGELLVPELYYVTKDKVEAEKAKPHSQTRVANHNIPLLWAQSLWVLGTLMCDGLLHKQDIDPLGRHRNIGKDKLPIVQVALLSEDEALQRKLEKFGVVTETPNQIAPISLRNANDMHVCYQDLGANDKMKLTGRPQRPIGALLSSRFLKIQGDYVAFLPAFMNRTQMYISYDHRLLVDNIRNHISYVRKFWRGLGRPTMMLMLTRQMFMSQQGLDAVLTLLSELSDGNCAGVAVRLGRTQELLLTSAVDRLDFLPKPLQFRSGPLHDLQRRGYLADIGHKRGSIADISLHMHALRGSSKSVSSSSLNNSGAMLGSTPPSQPPTPKLLRDLSSSNALRYSAAIEAEAIEQDSPEADEDKDFMESSRRLSLEEKAKLNELSMQALSALFQDTNNIYEQMDILTLLHKHHGPLYCLEFVAGQASKKKETISELMQQVHEKAGALELWSVLRTATALRKKSPFQLAGVISDFLIQGKEIAIGADNNVFIMREPVPHQQVSEICERYCNDLREALVIQEILFYLGLLVIAEPHLFAGLLRVRINYILYILIDEQAKKHNCSAPEGFEYLMELSPFDLKTLLHNVLKNEHKTQLYLTSTELDTAVANNFAELENGNLKLSRKQPGGWLRRRKMEGSLSHVPKKFYDNVYNVAENCTALVLRDRTLSSAVTAEMTRNEKNWCLHVEGLLDGVRRPERRQLIIDALLTLSSILTKRGKPVNGSVDLMAITELAAKYASGSTAENVDEETAFYNIVSKSPMEVASYISKAFTTMYGAM